MKQTYFKFLLCLLFLMTGVAAHADMCEIDGILYYTSHGTMTATVMKGQEPYSGDVIIPETILYEDENYTVNKISLDAFRNCSGLTSIAIPNSITGITPSSELFRGCTNLRKVILNNASLVSTDYYRYSGTLTSIFGQQVTEYVLGDNITAIGTYAFYDASNLTSITIPNTVQSLGGHCFMLCTSLTSAFIPKNVTSIGVAPFDRCEKIESIVVEEGNTVYDSRNGCNAIMETASNILIQGCNNTTIPEGTKEIGEAAFTQCASFVSLVIPDGVTKISTYAFADCTGVKSVTIPNSVTSIEDWAFRGCSAIETIYSKIENPFAITNLAFEYYTDPIYSTATLYVPIGTSDSYRATAGWKLFDNIQEYDYSAAVNGITTDSDAGLKEFYSIDGTQLDRPQRGINIIRMSDGTTRKVFVK